MIKSFIIHVQVGLRLQWTMGAKFSSLSNAAVQRDVMISNHLVMAISSILVAVT